MAEFVAAFRGVLVIPVLLAVQAAVPLIGWSLHESGLLKAWTFEDSQNLLSWAIQWGERFLVVIHGVVGVRTSLEVSPLSMSVFGIPVPL